MRKKNMFLLATGLVAAFCTTAAQAQDYPHKPIRLIVPYAAGGVTDVISRAIARQMSEQLKQVVVVDNRTGAGGNIGTDMIAKAAPDGYTIGIVTNGPMAANKTLYSHLPYNPETDFTPITLLFTVPYMVFVHPSLGVNNVQELVKLLKANPGKYSYAHGGIGTAQHFAARDHGRPQAQRYRLQGRGARRQRRARRARAHRHLQLYLHRLALQERRAAHRGRHHPAPQPAAARRPHAR
jgi:tripartite-type tricarboxylate transporter receptor subunit TctC